MTMTYAAPRLELWVEARAGQAAVNPVIASLVRHLAGDGGPATVRVPELDPLGAGPRTPYGAAPATRP